MKSFLTLPDRPLVFLAVLFILSVPAYGQEKPKASKGIDLDKELRAAVPQDRARSYYHYSLSKWFEESGDLDRAESEMRKAVQYNDSSSLLRVEWAGALFKNRNVKDAIAECREAIRLDPKNPESHWLLGYIYINSGESNKESLKKGIESLETMRAIAPEDERSHYLLGKAYFELGEPEKAVQAYEKFQTLRPDADVGYAAIADYYQKQGDIDKAIEYLSKATRRDDSARNLMMLAELYTQANKHSDAVTTFRKILKLSGENGEVKRRLGIALINSAKFDEAVTVLQEVVAATPSDAVAMTQLGRAYLGMRQFAEATKSLQSALAANPNNLEAEFYLGTSYEQTGNAPEAAKLFSKLLEITKSPKKEYSEELKANRAIFQQHLASAYLDMGEGEKAITLYEELVKADPDPDSQTLFLLINAYRINRQLDKALSLAKDQFEKKSKDSAIAIVYARALADAGKGSQGADILNKMIQSNPANVDLYVNLSQVYLQGKRYSDAEKILRRAQEKTPDSERLKFQLAAVYERQKEFERAETIFKEILKTNPENASALNYIGYMLADRGVRLDEAVQYVEKALALEPGNGSYLDSMGWALFKLNDLKQAEKYLLQAISKVKNDAVIHDHLGDLYYKTGDYDKAQDYWNKSLATGTEADEIQKVREKVDKLKETLRKQKRP